MRQLQPGDSVGGFVIEGVAGRGGMGVVYRARQREPDRLVALKVIAPEMAGDATFRRRFQSESAIAAQIEHPNVIPVYAVGEQDEVLYIAMRFVDGTDLRSLIAERGRMEPARAAGIVDQVAQALDAAHGQGLIHRDVKPANILLAASGGREHVYLTDFGLSRHTEGGTAMTVTGTFLGTVDYVAPEQARGERVDSRSDVYSLGCVLFHALSGTVPFPLENDLAKIYAHGTLDPPAFGEWGADLPAEFEAVVARALAKQPDDRYLSAGDLGRAALAAASGVTLTRAERSVAAGDASPQDVRSVATRPGTGSPTRPSAEKATRRRLPIIAAALAVAAVAIAAVLLATGGDSSTTPRTTGIVPGKSIGPVSLGQTRAQVDRALAGYKATAQSDPNSVEYAGGDNFSVYFDNGKAIEIQKYNDDTVKVKGVSIAATVAEAKAALPDWHTAPCGTYTYVLAPDSLTFFELSAKDPDSNGVAVVAADPTPYC